MCRSVRCYASFSAMSSACATRVRFMFIARAPLSFVLKIGALSSLASLIFGFLPREAWLVRAGEVLLEVSRPRTRTVNLVKVRSMTGMW